MDKPVTPCIGICKLDPTGTHCEGCWRTVSDLHNYHRHQDDIRKVVTEQFDLAGSPDYPSFELGFLQGFYYARRYPGRKRPAP